MVARRHQDRIHDRQRQWLPRGSRHQSRRQRRPSRRFGLVASLVPRRAAARRRRQRPTKGLNLEPTSTSSRSTAVTRYGPPRRRSHRIKPTLQIHDAHTGCCSLVQSSTRAPGGRAVGLVRRGARRRHGWGARLAVRTRWVTARQRLCAAEATDLSMAGSRAVFRTGRMIWLLDARTRKIVRLTTTKDAPIGLSIEANRIAWAENTRGHGRIRALLLSP